MDSGEILFFYYYYHAILPRFPFSHPLYMKVFGRVGRAGFFARAESAVLCLGIKGGGEKWTSKDIEWTELRKLA